MAKDEIRDRLADLIRKIERSIADTPWALRPADECYHMAEKLVANGVTILGHNEYIGRWIPGSEPPEVYRDEYGELIPFLVCEEGTEYPYRAMFDGKCWGDGIFAIPVKWWMPLPQAPKEET